MEKRETAEIAGLVTMVSLIRREAADLSEKERERMMGFMYLGWQRVLRLNCIARTTIRLMRESDGPQH